MSLTFSKHLSTAADQELADDQLPAGHTPVWIEPPRGATEVQMLEIAVTMAEQYQDVIVVHDSDEDERAAAWCEERGWRYLHSVHTRGCEAQCVVLLNCRLEFESITRGRNMLLIVDNRYIFSFLIFLI